MNEKINITFVIEEDNKVVLEVKCQSDPGVNIMHLLENDDQLDKVREFIPCACHGACACATCHVITDTTYQDDDLSDEELDALLMVDSSIFEEGKSRLGCQMILNEDCTIRIPVNSKSVLSNQF